jgi:ABC-2 type transport system ATP-binding protein
MIEPEGSTERRGDEVVVDGAGLVIRVRSPRAGALHALLIAEGATVTTRNADLLEVLGLPAEAIGDLAAARRLPLDELTPLRAPLSAPRATPRAAATRA